MKKFFLFLSILLNFSDLYASWIDTMLQQISLEEKIAQLVKEFQSENACPLLISQGLEWSLGARLHDAI